VLIRPEKETDYDSVYGVHVSAFPAPSEAILVNALRERAHPLVSLVAEDGDKVIRHILPSTRFGIDSEYEVPQEMLMAMEWVPGALGRNAGRVKYHAAFDDL